MNSNDEYSVPFQLHVLLESIEPEDTLLQEYVKIVVPNIINHFSTKSAKGGKDFLEKCRREGYNYHDKPDQSMVAHILNGIFPVMRIVQELEKRNLNKLSEAEQKLYLTAYTLHDLDKIVGEKDLYNISTEDSRKHLTQKLTEWIRHLAIDQFFPEYLGFLNDVIYLILNTQELYGADTLPYNYGSFTLSPRRRDILRDLSNLSDVLNYIDDKRSEGTMLTSPASLCQEKPAKPRKLLASLSDGRLFFVYHQLSAVTGLLSNLINNAIMHLMREQGNIPLLFFPNGVVYITEQKNEHSDIGKRLYEAVVDKISEACKSEVQRSLTGYTRAGKGLKFADYYYEIFSLKELLQISVRAVNKIIHDKKKPVSPDRLTSMLEMQQDDGKWNIPDHVDLHFEPSLEVDRLAEYFIVMENILETVPGISEVDTAIFKSLDLFHYLEDARSIPDKGGAKYRWYFIAGKYLQQHRGLDAQELTEVMRKTAQTVVEHFRVHIEQYESEQEKFSVLRSYLNTVVDVNGLPIDGKRNFVQELTMYASAHKSGRGRGLMCSLCSTPYNTDKQQETAIPFQPQVYSNKLPLNKQADRRGICEVCALELMLRQILMKSRNQLTGAQFENQKVKYLYIYPSYYFTTETARYVSRLYNDSLKRLELFKIRRTLGESKNLQVKDFLELEDFQIERDDDDEKKPSRFFKMELPKNDLATLFFFGVPSFERNPTDTDSWIVPAFLAFALPFVFTAKVVASEFPLPLYATGNDFKETVILDAPHHFLLHLLGNDRFRIDEVFNMLQLLTSVYGMHLDVYSSTGKPNWNQINEVAANLDTDTMYVFHYLMKFQRKKGWDSIPRNVVARYLNLYHLLQREGDMSIFKGLVDRYYTFYHPADFNAHNILRPISIVISLTIKSDKELSEEDAILEMIGELKGAQDRVHSRQAKGYAPLGGYEELAAVRKFTEFFYKEVFQDYCHGERALLRDRANRIKSGCEAYYLETYAPRKKNQKEEE